MLFMKWYKKNGTEKISENVILVYLSQQSQPQLSLGTYSTQPMKVKYNYILILLLDQRLCYHYTEVRVIGVGGGKILCAWD
jgi:hypothetical protein